MYSSHIQTADPWQHIGQIADRIRRLCPDHRDPERFHIEKSEIEHELRELARVLPAPKRIRVGVAREFPLRNKITKG